MRFFFLDGDTFTTGTLMNSCIFAFFLKIDNSVALYSFLIRGKRQKRFSGKIRSGLAQKDNFPLTVSFILSWNCRSLVLYQV
jgi:hypothetical protein